MSAPAPQAVSPATRSRAVHERLFDDAEADVFAVLDGASVPGLLRKLHEHQPEHICLYRGELAPDLAECAPHLVRLSPRAPFTEWVLQEGWGQHWGIFAMTSADLTALRKHFRTFMLVRGPDGKRLYFRYYDPRVLRVYLPTCNPEELKVVFGPVTTYLCEDEKPNTLLSFRTDGMVAKREACSLLS